MTRRRATERAATIALVLALSGCVSRGAALSREELVGDWGLSGSDWALRLAADGTLANATSAEFDDPWVTGRWRLAGDVLTVEFRGGGQCIGEELGRYRVRRSGGAIRFDATADSCWRRVTYLDKEILRRVDGTRPRTATVARPGLPPLSPVGGAGPIAAALVGEWRQPYPASQSWLHLFADGRITVGVGEPHVAQVDGLWRLDGDVITFDNVAGLCSIPSRNRRARYRVAVDGETVSFRVVGADGCRERRTIDREIWRRHDAWWQVPE